MRKEEILLKKFGQKYSAGTLLFQEGEACGGMYMIIKGQVRLFKKFNQEELTIDILQDGDFFGEMACLTNQPRSVNALVERESEILVIPPEHLETLLRESPEISFKIVAHLAQRLKKVYEILGSLITENKRLKLKNHRG